MAILTWKKLYHLQSLRLFAIFLPFVFLPLRFFVCGSVTLSDVQYLFILSLSAIFLLPFLMENYIIAFIFLVGIILCDPIYLVVRMLQCEWLYMLFKVMYAFLVILSFPICVMIKLYRSLCNRNFLTSCIRGTDFSLEYIKLILAILYQPIASAYVVAMFFNINDRIFNLIGVCFVSFFYILLSIRSGTSIVSSFPEKDTFSEVSSRGNTSDIKENNTGFNILYERMCVKMKNEKPFLSPTFNIDELARELYSNRGYISKMINSCTGKNFNLLINTYRVNHAVDIFKSDPSMKVVELMEKSGFNNPVTFNNAFKIVMKRPPGEWCDLYREQLIENARKEKLSRTSEG